MTRHSQVAAATARPPGTRLSTKPSLGLRDGVSKGAKRQTHSSDTKAPLKSMYLAKWPWPRLGLELGGR